MHQGNNVAKGVDGGWGGRTREKKDESGTEKGPWCRTQESKLKNYVNSFGHEYEKDVPTTEKGNLQRGPFPNGRGGVKSETSGLFQGSQGPYRKEKNDRRT